MTGPRQRLVCSLAMVLVALPLLGASAAENRTIDNWAAVREGFETAVSGGLIAGGSLYVAQYGEPVFREGFGAANIDSGRPFTAENPVYIASVSKTLSASVLAILADQGKLSLDDRVDKYLPAFAHIKLRSTGEEAVPPTIRQLLSHTSGIMHSTSFLALSRQFPEKWALAGSLEEMADLLAELGLEHTPGTKWLYSGMAYAVVGRVAEVAGGADFETLMRRLLLDPLGMPDTGFLPSDAVLRKVPSLYRMELEGLQAMEMPSFVRHAGLVFPGGGIVSTLDDIARFFQMHLNNGRHGGRQLISEAMVADMHSPQPASPSYGLGFRLDDGEIGHPARRLGHFGGAGTWAWMDKERRIVVILFTQSSIWRSPIKGVRIRPWLKSVILDAINTSLDRAAAK